MVSYIGYLLNEKVLGRMTITLTNIWKGAIAAWIATGIPLQLPMGNLTELLENSTDPVFKFIWYVVVGFIALLFVFKRGWKAYIEARKEYKELKDQGKI